MASRPAGGAGSLTNWTYREGRGGAIVVVPERGGPADGRQPPVSQDPVSADEPGPLSLGSLERWMDDHGLPGAGEPISWSLFGGGTQNLIYRIRRGDTEMVLRRPPRNAPPGRGATMLREYRILAALADTDVPHPAVLGASDDPGILGEPFYMMGFVDGWSPASGPPWPEPFATDPAARREIAFQIVDGAARLASVDYEARGLGDLGRPDGFHDRQVDRWLSHLAQFQFREIPGLAESADWLRRHRPRRFMPGLMHGDYHFGNVIFGHTRPGRLAAIVDWEMATVGDPLLDLAWLLMTRRRPGDPTDSMVYTDFTGMPSDGELIDYYARVSGRDVRDFQYYAILARFKMAIVLEGGYARYVRGSGWSDRLQKFGDIVVRLAARSAELSRASTMR
jgi:aminoglycoside phosphotransferase (APT) family kinase protein